ncbi:MAG: 8-amino-7-oxononanoate synthase [Rhodocyclaceae bacterium]
MSLTPTPTPALQALREQLDRLEAEALLRRRRVVNSPCLTEVSSEGAALLSFASNDYLGLAAHPVLAESAAEGAKRWGVGAGASHLVSGHTAVHEALEQALASFVGCDAALVFSTGYLANIAVMPALLGRNGEIFADRLNHASLVNGALLSRATVHRYAHNDVAALEKLLAASTARDKLIVSDGVFSMDGDIAPLAALLSLAERFDAWLLIDDAHGFGVLGPQGRGSIAAAGLRSERLIHMATLGKAAGVSGAFIAGTRTLMDWLLQKSRPYIFTTAMPPMLAHVLLHALALIEDADDRRHALMQRIAQLRSALPGKLLPSTTAIQPLLIGDNAAALQLSAALRDAGIWVPAIRPPTVPAGTARLRISLSAAHGEDQVERLIAAIAKHGGASA